MSNNHDTHRKTIGYILWIFGFTGSHRFYYGKPVSGTIYLFTLGLFFIGWIVDLFLIPSMDRQADIRFQAGGLDYNLTWILLTLLGIFGIHRMYSGYFRNSPDVYGQVADRYPVSLHRRVAWDRDHL